MYLPPLKRGPAYRSRVVSLLLPDGHRTNQLFFRSRFDGWLAFLVKVCFVCEGDQTGPGVALSIFHALKSSVFLAAPASSC